ncbi:MAG: hypothetical protein JNK19_05635 [Tabrizicola sp.]|mgnify:CR=1 FL=1|jgi:hypothetical protein|nr:hypothetical protein [Tabrizicola sp.]
MRDENFDILEVRVWLKEEDGQVLIGERFRRQDGRISVTWHVDPKSILGVVWVEDVKDTRSDVSAS